MAVSDEEWSNFKKTFNKSYKDETEEQMRRERFAKAKITVEEHNKKYEAGEVTWKMGLNHLSDATEEEFAMRCGKKNHPPA